MITVTNPNPEGGGYEMKVKIRKQSLDTPPQPLLPRRHR